MMKRLIPLVLAVVLLLVGCNYSGYSVKSFVGTTEPDNPQHRLVEFVDFRGQREAIYEFKAATAIKIELETTKGKMDLELRAPNGQSLDKLSANGYLTTRKISGQFAAGNYSLILKSTTASSGSIKVFFD